MTRWRWVIATVATVVALSGCGTASTAKGGWSSSPTTRFDTLEASAILDAAQQAASRATSVHLKGTVESVTIDMFLDGDNAKGTVSGKGGSIELIRVGTKYWVSGDAGFWTASGLPPSAVAKMPGKYADMSAASANFASFTDLHNLFSSAFKGNKPTKGDVTNVNGVEVITLIDTDGSRLFIATQGEPLPMRGTTADGSTLNLTEWNLSLTVTPPPASKIVDVTTLR